VKVNKIKIQVFVAFYGVCALLRTF